MHSKVRGAVVIPSQLPGWQELEFYLVLKPREKASTRGSLWEKILGFLTLDILCDTSQRIHRHPVLMNKVDEHLCLPSRPPASLSSLLCSYFEELEWKAVIIYKLPAKLLSMWFSLQVKGESLLKSGCYRSPWTNLHTLAFIPPPP